MKVLDVVAVKFVGKTQIRHDNICGSGTVWRFQGDVQLLEKEHADSLAKYPGTWKIVPVPDFDAPTMEEVQEKLTEVSVKEKSCDAKMGDTKTREEKIVSAISSLEKDNQDHFTPSGKPRTDALRSLMSDITAPEVNRVWQKLVKEKDNAACR